MTILGRPLASGFREIVIHTSIDRQRDADLTEGGAGLEHSGLVDVVQPEVSDGWFTLHVADQL